MNKITSNSKECSNSIQAQVIVHAPGLQNEHDPQSPTIYVLAQYDGFNFLHSMLL